MTTTKESKIDLEMISGWGISIAIGIAAINPEMLPPGLPSWVRPTLGVFALLVAALNHSPRKAKALKS